MATNIEQRVVQMRFDNAQFEKGIAQSYNSLDAFEKKLNFKGASKGLEQVQAVANQVSLSHLTQEADGVGKKFDAMAVAAVTALTRITNAAISAGTGLAKSLTLDPIATGFNEYELKLNSIQTILANTKRHGTTIDEVSAALDDLNRYADKTIYNFGQMTQSIGMFTTAGIKLEPAKEAIKGIANLAAYVGAPASDASRAMYQLSQGLATGYINLRDWMSLENTAGMSGIEFQDRLKATARIFGKNVDAMIKKNGSFRESLKEGWLTSEVLIETLKQFSGEVDATYLRQQGWTEAQIQSILELGRTATESATVVKSFTQLLDTLKESAQSGWAESWEIIIGGLDEAKRLWTNVNNVISGIIEGQADQRNEMLRTWASLGGRTAAIETIGAAFQNLFNIVSALKNAIDDIFPPMTGERLYAMTLAVKNFVDGLTLSDEAVNTLRVSFKALLLPVQLVVSVLEVAVVAAGRAVQSLVKMVDTMLAWPSKFSTIEDAFASVFGNERAHRMAEALGKIVSNLSNAFGILRKNVKGFFSSINFTGLSSLTGVFESLRDILEQVGGWILDRFIDGLELIANADFSWVISGLTLAYQALERFVSGLNFTSPIAFFKSLMAAISELVTKFREMVLMANFTQMFEGVISVAKRFGNVLLGIAQAAQELIAKLTPAKILVFSFGAALVGVFYNLSKALGAFAGIAKSTIGVIDGVKNVMSAVAERIRGNKLLQIALAIGALAAALIILGTVDPERLKGATLALTSLMGALLVFVGGMAAINKFLVGSPEMVKNLQQIGVAMLAMASSIAVLSGALAILSTINVSDIGRQLLDLGVMILAMVVAAVAIGKYASNLEKTSVYVISFAASVYLMVAALEKIGKVDLSGAAPNLILLATAMGLFTLVSKSMSKVKFSSMAGLMLFAFDILAFAGVLSLMSKMDPANLIIGLINMIPIFGAFAGLALAIRVAGGQSSRMGSQLLLMSAAILVLKVAIEKIGSLDNTVIAKGMGVVTALLALFSGIIVLSGFARQGMKSGTAFIAMSAAILILSLAISYIGNLDLATIVKGTTVVSALLVLFGIINAVGGAAGSAKGSIIAMSVCLGLLVASLAVLTLLDFNELMGASVALGLVMVAMASMLHGAKNLKIGSAMGAILELIAVVSMLGLMFKYLDGVDPKSTLAAAVGVGVVLAALNLSFNQVKVRTGSGKNLVKTIVAMIATLAAVATIFSLLQRFGQGEQPIQNAVSIGIILGALSASFDAIKVRTGSGKNLAKTMAAMISMLAAVATIFSLLQRFGQGEQPIQNAIAVSTILLSLSGAMGILNGVNAPKDMVTTLVTMASMLTMATIVIGILNAMPLNEGLIEKTASMSVLLIALSGAIAILSKVGMSLSMLGSVAGAAIGGVGAALVMVGLIGAFILAVGAAFEHFEGLEAALEKAEEIFPRIGSVIGSFFGHILGGFVGGAIGGAIEELGTSLTNFATNVQGFLSLRVSQDLVDSIGRIALIVGTITAVEFIQALTTFGKGDALERFGDQLVTFGGYFKQFADSLKDIPVDSVNASANAMEGLASVLANIPSQGGLLGMIFGKKDLSGFGDGLSALAEGIADYATTVNDANITQTTVEKTQLVMEALTEMVDTVPRSGGLISFLGEKNIGKFGEQLATFAQSLLKSFAVFNNPAINVETAKKVETSGKALTSLANTVPKSGPLINFLGAKDLGKFGEQLVAYAKALKSFFDELDEVIIDQRVADSAAKAGRTMAGLADDIQKTGPLITFFGEKNLGTFGERIGQFGAGLSSFFKSINDSGISPDAISLSETAAMSFIKISEALGTNTGLSTLMANTDLSVFGGQISSLGLSFSYYYDYISTIAWATVKESVDQLARIADLAPKFANTNAASASGFAAFMFELSRSGITEFVTAFSNAEKEMSDAIYNTIDSSLRNAKSRLDNLAFDYAFVVDAIIRGISSGSDELAAKARDLIQVMKTTIEAQSVTINQIGTFMINAISTSFERGIDSLKNAVKRVVAAALAQTETSFKINGQKSMEFYKIGQYCIAGYLEGFEKNAAQLYTRMAQIGNQVVRTFSDATGVNSPSVKFAEIGMYSILGYVQGIKDYTSVGKDAMVKMGETLLTSIKDFFKIESPSKVTRDEVGRYIVEGIAEGITNDMSAEEAARQKAQNIVNAFQSEFNRLSAQMNTASMEFDLWSKMNPQATGSQSTGMKVDLLNTQLQLQAKTVMNAEAQYKATLQAIGESATETQEAYQSYLQEKINMADLAGQLSEIRNSNTEAFGEFYNNMGDMYDELTRMGFSHDEVERWAKNQSGWVDMSGVPTGNVEQIMQQYLEQAQVGAQGVEVVIREGTQKAVDSSVQTARTGGTQAGQAYTQSVKQAVDEGGAGMFDGAFNTEEIVSKAKEGFSKIGSGEVEGAINGISSGISSLRDAAMRAFGSEPEAAVREYTQTHSPSQLYASIGTDLINGYIQGIQAAGPQASTATTDVVSQAYAAVLTYVPQFTSIGQQMMQGMLNGIQSMASSVVGTASSIAQRALAATRGTLGIHSPSREYYRIGKLIDQGLSEGILDNYHVVEGSLVEITDSMRDMDYELIRPVEKSSGGGFSAEDLINQRAIEKWSEEQQALKKLNKEYSQFLQFTSTGEVIPFGEPTSASKDHPGSHIRLDDATMKQVKDLIHAEGYKPYGGYENKELNDLLDVIRSQATPGNITKKDQEAWKDSPTYSFTQYNYSPKSLSTAEIARQTQTAASQFSTKVSTLRLPSDVAKYGPLRY